MMRFIALLAALAGLATAAAAQPVDKRAAREACMPDYKKFCAQVAPGGGRVARCLEQNINELTPACKAMLTSSAAAKGKQ